MAVAFILLGSVFGFAWGLGSVLFFGAGVLTGLAIWSGLGVLGLLIGVGLAMLPETRDAGAVRTAAHTA